MAVADLASEAASETVALVNAAGGQAISLSGDMSKDADVRAMIEPWSVPMAGWIAPSTTPALPAGRSMPAQKNRGVVGGGIRPHDCGQF